MTATEDLLRFDRVSFGFEDGPDVVDGLDLVIRRNEFVSVLGPSGCGKSTALNLAAGLLQPREGVVVYDGEPVTTVNTAVGYMTQHDTLLPWKTTADNVGLPLRFVRPRPSRTAIAQRVAAALERVNLGDAGAKFPAQLSGGMKRRAVLARSVIADPAMILMDEPFSALDAQLAGQMRTQVRRVVEAMGQTVMFVTHDIDESLLMSDRVVVLGVPGARIVGEVVVPFGNDRDAEAVRVTDGYLTLRAELHALLEAAYPARAGTEADEPATAGPARRT
ncbi:MAG: ABC transporter ATP-binding protein [Pseudonocardia sp.]